MVEESSNSDSSSDQSQHQSDGEVKFKKEFWTGVLNTKQMAFKDVPMRNINIDVSLFQNQYQKRENENLPDIQAYFDPKIFNQKKIEWDREQSRSTNDELMNFALKATQLRAIYRKRAQNLIHQSQLDPQKYPLLFQNLPSLSKRDNCKSEKQEKLSKEFQIFQDFSNLKKLKPLTLCDLSHTRKKQIIAFYISSNSTQKDTALKFQVSSALVSRLYTQYKNNPHIFDQESSKLANKRKKVEAIQEIIENFQDKKQSIWTSEQIQKDVQREKKIKVERQLVCKVLSKGLNWKYRKIKRIPFVGNSERSIELRVKYAKVMFDILETENHIINIDETWIDSIDFRRQKWQKQGINNTLPFKDVNPRLSLIVGISNYGQVYSSVTQVNTNSDVFSVYLEKLHQKLLIERNNYREDTMILIDGAKYHTNEITRNTLKRLKIKVIFSAPYSFETAPIELFFSLLKSKQLLKPDAKVGKKAFKQLIIAINEKILEIPENVIVSLWVKIIQHHFEFICLRIL